MCAVEGWASATLAQLAAVRREALAAFGDATSYLSSREIQIPRDKLWSPLLIWRARALGSNAATRKKFLRKVLRFLTLRRAEMVAALRIAHFAGYVNAGTLEFALDEDQQFPPLEMNTRLQAGRNIQ